MSISQQARAAATRERPTQSPGFEAGRLLDDLVDLEPKVRTMFLAQLNDADLAALFDVCAVELGTPFGLWQDDPLGFALGPLGQSLWSKQRRILAAYGQHPRVIVPSSVGVGKTLTASMVVAHTVCCWPPGTARAITTASRLRQVRALLWPEIRHLHAVCDLPGRTDLTQWYVAESNGSLFRAAEGISVSPHEPEAAQGYHARGRLTVVIDEAGGIAPNVGKAFVGLVTTEDARMVAIGNPPETEEGSWFEEVSRSEGSVTITIDLLGSPAFTGEDFGPCRTCPVEIPEHSPAKHMTGPEWWEDVKRDHGEDSPYAQAKGRARFPKGGPSRALPGDWLDQAMELTLLTPQQLAEELGETRPETSYDRENRPYLIQPRRGAWIRLGVDVAADGGDELAISRAEGEIVRFRHAEAGPNLASSHYAAGIVLQEIRQAEALRARLGTKAKVRVKVDAIGIGVGVCSVLEAWASEGVHDAVIVRVNVAEKIEPGRERDDSTLKPQTKRDEMWLAFRENLQPDAHGRQAIVLDVDGRSRGQLGGPMMGTRMSNGTTFIESKPNMRRRGLKSPDRGESALLATYEPYDLDRQPYRSVLLSGA